MSSSLNYVEKKNEMCPIFFLFLTIKFPPRITLKKAAQFLGLLKAACQTFMFRVISTCNAIISQKIVRMKDFEFHGPHT